MSEFDSPRPDFSEKEIRRILKDEYGLDAAVTALVGDRDQNILVTPATGAERYVLKISNTTENRDLLTLQNDLVAHLAVVAPSLGLVPAVMAKSGDHLPVVQSKSGTGRHFLRLTPYVEGVLLSEVRKTPALYQNVGTYLGALSKGMEGFGHPAAYREGFLWSLDNAVRVEPYADAIPDAADRALVGRVFDRYRHHVLPRLPRLRISMLHQDVNDNNIVLRGEKADEVRAVIDFGDAAMGRTVNELAIALAYLLMDEPDFYASARAVITAYTRVFPLTSDELEVLFDLMATRLAVSVCISSHRSGGIPDDDYLTVSQAPAFDLLRKLDSVNKDFLGCFARVAGGMPACPDGGTVVKWLKRHRRGFKAILGFDLYSAPRLLVSLQDGAPGADLAGDQAVYAEWLADRMVAKGARFAIGAYLEDRTCYRAKQFEAALGGNRSVHLGVDLFAEAGTTVHAPLPGIVVSVQDNDAPQDYGPTVILKHRAGDDGPVFYTLYGHLSIKTLAMVTPGQAVDAGEVIGWLGGLSVNGGWAPHLHFQIMTTLLGQKGNFYGACEGELMDVWRQVCPDPNLILGLARESFHPDTFPKEQMIEARRDMLGPSLSLSYDDPLKIVRGDGASLYDETGRQYLDCVNNICHVGHSNPRVVGAIVRQAAILNTNTRYLHDTILAYSERLLATLPDHLEVVYFVCTGSEANELALRLARTYGGRKDIITLDWGYHGNTAALIDVSPYKFKRRGGKGKKEHVHVAELPSSTAGKPLELYLASIQSCIAAALDRSAGVGPAAMIAESISGCGGQVVLPDGYLKAAFEAVQAAGGVAIADEVQVGFGRTGQGMWSFAAQGARPDIVTMGKPMGNGHPVAAVATTRAIADAFANGMEYFNSFGGNPVSLAAASAVLDEIEQRDLIKHAGDVGAYLLQACRDLQKTFPAILDVRGQGLFLGLEMSGTLASEIINFARSRAVLLSTDGPENTVIKIKPPLVFSYKDADRLVSVLRRALEYLCG